MKKYWKEIILALMAAVLLSLSGYLFVSSRQSPGAPTLPPVSSTLQPGKASPLTHIFVIMEENESSSAIDGNSQAPYINALIKNYAYAANFSAVSHPSLPNYLALTGGSTLGITSDCSPLASGCNTNALNIADEIESSGRTWKAYAESMPVPCDTSDTSEYAVKHEPFLYYDDILSNKTRCDGHVVPYSALTTDLKTASTTPDFAFITPNLCDDMHNCSISAGDTWLAQNVPLILNSPTFKDQNSLLVITWDEGTGADNKVATIFAGPAARSGYRSNQAFNDYSLLHTIENLWGLGTLTSNDQNAPLMNALLRAS